MLFDNIYVDYYPCYDKAWSIVEFEFLIWTNIYFELIDVMNWVLKNKSVYLNMIWTYSMLVRISILTW
jgi:hypothetical protein